MTTNLELDITSREIFLSYNGDKFVWSAGIIEISRQINAINPLWVKVNISAWDNEDRTKVIKRVLSIAKRTKSKLHLDEQKKQGYLMMSSKTTTIKEQV